jgi:hypothetical protein
MSFSKCMSIVNKMHQGDQDSLLSKLDEFQSQGMSPKEAQFAAVRAVMREIDGEISHSTRDYQSNFEVAPDPNDKALSAQWNALSLEAKQRISRVVADDVVSKVLNQYGAKGELVEQIGSYMDDTNPSFALQTDSPSVDAISKALGFSLSQDSMANFSALPFAGSEKAQAVVIELGDKSFDEVQAIYNTIRSKVPQVSGQSYTGGNMTILNVVDWTGIETADLMEKIDNALGGVYDIANKDFYYSFPEKKDYNYDDREKTQSESRGGVAESVHQASRRIRAEASDRIKQEIAREQASEIGLNNRDGKTGGGVIYSKRDLFGGFANKAMIVDTGIVINSKGDTKQGGNVDSDGRKITGTTQGLKNFWHWFGNSDAVDTAGKPLLLYHSTQGDISEFEIGRETVNNYGLMGDLKTTRAGIFATPDKDSSEGFLRGDADAVMPVYMSLQKAFDMRNPDQTFLRSMDRFGFTREWRDSQNDWAMFDNNDDGSNPFVEKLKEHEYDGAIFIDSDENGKEFETYVAFEPTQVKSALGNLGTYNQDDGRISYSMRSGTSTWDMFDSSKFDDITYRLQDKHIDTKRVIESIKKYVGAVSNDVNVYLQEELFHGRTAKRTADFAHNELEPMMKEIARAGYKITDVEEYLQARHAPEANRVIAQRNPNEPGLQDGGSGMTNAAASAYMASLSAVDLAKMQAIAARVDAILDKTRQTYVDYGLESAATVNGWTSMFKHYIPLHREDKEGRMGIGQGFSVKGKETRGRTGSKRKVVDILANIAMERERLIVRGEKNRVSKALLGLAIANPNPEFWSVGTPPATRAYDPKTNTVVERVDPMYKMRENVIVSKVKDAAGNVKEVGVVFNEDDERAMRMAQALKNLDAANLEGVLGVSAKITRYFSAVNTQYNPVFGVVNLTRDIQHAMITLDRTPLARKKSKIARDTVSAVAGIYSDMRAVRQGNHPTSQWAQLFEDFENEGGQTGYRQMFANSKDRADELESVLNPDAWLEGKWGKVFTANGMLKVPLSKAKSVAAPIFDWLSDYNESMENGVRLAAYKAGLDTGMSKQEAASLAKNLTVNFNRKGQVGLQAGAMYAFFNASVQGTANIGQTIFNMEGGNVKTIRLSSVGKKVVYGGLLIGAMQAMMLAAAGFRDDDPPTFVRDKNLIIPTGGKGFITIPMPQGFNVLPAMGRQLTEFAMSGFKDPAKRAIGLMGLFADSFNPIGNAGLSMQTVTPTALDPFVALRENKDFAGRPIARVSSNPAVPGFTQFKDSATVIGKIIAEAINSITGGNAYLAGVLSPTPDQVDYLLGQVTGGVGRELSKVEQTSLSLATGEDLPIYKIPLAGRFYGDTASQASQASQFYNNVNHLNELETEIKGMQKDKKFTEAREVMRENPDAYMMAQANVAERQVQRLRKEKRELVDKGASREVVKAKETQITAVMTRLNQTMERLKEKQAAH